MGIQFPVLSSQFGFSCNFTEKGMAFSYNDSITNYPKKGLAHLGMFLIKKNQSQCLQANKLNLAHRNSVPNIGDDDSSDSDDSDDGNGNEDSNNGNEDGNNSNEDGDYGNEDGNNGNENDRVNYSNYDDPNDHDIGDIYGDDSNKPYINEETHADPDMEIDEVLPSEDDRAAEVFLRFSQGNGSFHLQLQWLILCLIL